MNKQLIKYLLSRVLWINLSFTIGLAVWACTDLFMITHYREPIKMFWGTLAFSALLVYRMLGIGEEPSLPFLRGFSREMIWNSTVFAAFMSYLFAVGTGFLVIVLPIREVFLTLFGIGEFAEFRPWSDFVAFTKSTLTFWIFFPIFLYHRVRLFLDRRLRAGRWLFIIFMIQIIPVCYFASWLKVPILIPTLVATLMLWLSRRNNREMEVA